MNSSQAQKLSGKKEPFPIALLSLTLGAFAIGMTEFVIMGILPNVAEDLHVSISKAGQLITGYALGVAIGAPILTIFTHRVPQKMLLCLLMFLFILGNAFAIIAPNYELLMGARLLTALCHGTFFGVGAVIASKLVQAHKRASAVATMMAGLTIANIVGVPVGTFIGQHLGWRASFGAITIMGLIAFIGIIIFIPKLRQEASSNLTKQFSAFKQPKLLLFLLLSALGCGSLFTVFTYITPLLVDVTGFHEHSVTWILVLYGCGVTLGNIVGGKLADWKLMPSIFGIFATICVLLLIFTVTVKSPVAAVITMFFWGAAAFAVMPGVQVKIMNLAHEAPALASTSNHSAANLGNAFGAFLGGVVITHMGLTSLPWIGATFVAVAFIIGFSIYVVESKGRSRVQA
ncbi:MFS transporter [Priestia endophytica]|jgi:MFS transporter, DHA1 family, inner membrane transport protein|uniref:MFS transporter, DHA1 family, arabinose polymer transporter n=1 Tax=Priestia endophytica DSM 13796 TaxID=1121089 RepID=A0A1I5YV48_9BACI|nr:MFS transporter [Priestia endophytica]KYG28032.1 arabinose transporter permease [Priestia endophytica]SFQ47717.1 MFS transporter, DHA1 family, arabinose polymer transporter [Priestia endophytica DSM 13796]